MFNKVSGWNAICESLQPVQRWRQPFGEGGKEFGAGSRGAEIEQRKKAGGSEVLTLTCQDFAEAR